MLMTFSIAKTNGSFERLIDIDAWHPTYKLYTMKARLFNNVGILFEFEFSFNSRHFFCQIWAKVSKKRLLKANVITASLRRSIIYPSPLQLLCVLNKHTRGCTKMTSRLARSLYKMISKKQPHPKISKPKDLVKPLPRGQRHNLLQTESNFNVQRHLLANNHQPPRMLTSFINSPWPCVTVLRNEVVFIFFLFRIIFESFPDDDFSYCIL